MRGALWSYGLLGAIVTSISLASLCIKVFDLGLAPVTGDAISAYRAVAHPIMGFLLGWTHWIWPDWHIPGWVKDLYALSFVGAFGYARGYRNAPSRKWQGEIEVALMGRVGATITYSLAGFVAGALFLGLVFYLGAIDLAIGLMRGKGTEIERANMSVIAINMFGGLIGALGFLALNFELMRNLAH